jgi:hypothetical protein
VGFGAVLVSFRVQAQTASAPHRVDLAPIQQSAGGAVYVQLHAGERAYSVTTAGGSRHEPNPVIANCDGDCGFWAWPGSYKLRFPASGDERAKTVNLRILAPGDYTLMPPDVAARNTGLTFGVAGSAVAGVGLILFIAGLFATPCEDDSKGNGKCAYSPAIYYGLGTLAVGGGIATSGWLVYAQNRAHFVHRSPLAAATAQSVAARVGLMPLPRGGFGLGAAVAF